MCRSILFVSITALAVALAACAGDGSDPQPPAEEPAFTVVSADVTIAPGEETTKCFYFHTPNTAILHVHK